MGMGERQLMRSGLIYTIVRPTGFEIRTGRSPRTFEAFASLGGSQDCDTSLTKRRA